MAWRKKFTNFFLAWFVQSLRSFIVCVCVLLFILLPFFRLRFFLILCLFFQSEKIKTELRTRARAREKGSFFLLYFVIKSSWWYSRTHCFFLRACECDHSFFFIRLILLFFQHLCRIYLHFVVDHFSIMYKVHCLFQLTRESIFSTNWNR